MWSYDLRTNTHFTFKTKRLVRLDVDQFVGRYRPANGSCTSPRGRGASDRPLAGLRPCRFFARDQASLDIFWLRDESSGDGADLPEPYVLAQEIADDLR